MAKGGAGFAALAFMVALGCDGGGSDVGGGGTGGSAGTGGTGGNAGTGGTAGTECLEDAHCSAATQPICDLTTNLCRGCVSGDECASEVCLETGACADAEEVLYVEQPGGDDANDCTFAARCATVSGAVNVAPMTRSVIKVRGTITDGSLITLGDRDIEVYGDATAVLTRNTTGEIVRVDGTGAVSMFDLQIRGAIGPGGSGVIILGSSTGAITLRRLTVTDNAELGIYTEGQGTLSLSRSTISLNDGGGLRLSGTHVFDVTSNVIVHNGAAEAADASAVGGAEIHANTLGSRFEFNTLAFNESSGIINRGGISCVAPMVSAAGNIVYRNGESDGAAGVKIDSTTQVNPDNPCQFGNSLILAQDANHLGFVRPLNLPLDFHLQATSPASVVDAGGDCSVPDIDNEPRPAGEACDLGADELSP